MNDQIAFVDDLNMETRLECDQLPPLLFAWSDGIDYGISLSEGCLWNKEDASSEEDFRDAVLRGLQERRRQIDAAIAMLREGKP